MRLSRTYNLAQQKGRIIMKTLIVNFFAGPGAGKSTCAWQIASALKKRGINCEYVSEAAKDYVWDENFEMLNGSVENQTKVYEEQKHRRDRLIGKVDVVVTDSPILLSTQYLKNPEQHPDFINRIKSDFAAQDNFNIFIERSEKYQQAGRVQSAAEAKEIDKKIKQMLDSERQYYGTYRHDTVYKAVNNLIRTYHQINNAKAPAFGFNDESELSHSDVEPEF